MSYYRQNISGERLRRVYELAPPRVRQYMEAEIRFLQYRLHPGDEVLELGCGYGRVMLELAPRVRGIMGVDLSPESLELGRKLAGDDPRMEFLEMNALNLTFPDNLFDAVLCVQNGICAFHVNPEKLVLEALRVTRRGGCAFFSSYTEAFWPHRLEWFGIQASHGLVGEIDYDRTGDGIIVCKDGFRAGAMAPQDFRSLCALLRLTAEITEVDASSTFCVIAKDWKVI
jgi:2-polyprenyl-6-hydroxyphenyl methylase/3-demethylubiquinone-9 3-methyltransferase